MSQNTDEVLAIERRFWTDAGDHQFVAEHMTDGGISVIEPMGVIQKEQFLAMPVDAPWQDVEMQDVVVRELTPDLVIVAYHGRGQRAGDDKPYRGSIASAYVRLAGRWQLAMTAHQPWTPKQDESPPDPTR